MARKASIGASDTDKNLRALGRAWKEVDVLSREALRLHIANARAKFKKMKAKR